MTDTEELVEFDVELDKAAVEFLDQEAARLGCTRNDLLCRAVDEHLDRIGQLFREREEKRKGQEDASRTDHAAGRPPTAD